jgi:nucleoside-diphosphate-sugar epimerase
MVKADKVILTGGAGLVGQNLIHVLKQNGYGNIVSIDKHVANHAVVRRLHPDVTAIDADLALPGEWERHLEGATALVLLQAQIGALVYSEFAYNTIETTKRVLAAAEHYQIPYMVHVSSSVVHSRADDFYSRSKREQEQIVEQTSIKHCVLRPTLMFGWFDRKHLGWLARFMSRMPVFPVPGNGRYVRQALFELDFCAIIQACIEKNIQGAYNISGLERIYYIDLIKELRSASGATTRIVKIPYWLFWFLLKAYALVDRHPPFTTQQLAALVIPEEFEMIDWPSIFGVKQTPVANALIRTFQEKPYCDIVLEF